MHVFNGGKLLPVTGNSDDATAYTGSDGVLVTKVHTGIVQKQSQRCCAARLWGTHNAVTLAVSPTAGTLTPPAGCGAM